MPGQYKQPSLRPLPPSPVAIEQSCLRYRLSLLLLRSPPPLLLLLLTRTRLGSMLRRCRSISSGQVASCSLWSPLSRLRATSTVEEQPTVPRRVALGLRSATYGWLCGTGVRPQPLRQLERTGLLISRSDFRYVGERCLLFVSADTSLSSTSVWCMRSSSIPRSGT